MLADLLQTERALVSPTRTNLRSREDSGGAVSVEQKLVVYGNLDIESARNENFMLTVGIFPGVAVSMIVSLPHKPRDRILPTAVCYGSCCSGLRRLVHSQIRY